MKPRLKLHLNGAVSLAQPPIAYAYNQPPRFNRHMLVAHMRAEFGSVSAWHRTFGVPHTLTQTALDVSSDTRGASAGALRVMLGLPTSSDSSTKPLDPAFRIPLAALTVVARASRALPVGGCV